MELRVLASLTNKSCHDNQRQATEISARKTGLVISDVRMVGRRPQPEQMTSLCGARKRPLHACDTTRTWASPCLGHPARQQVPAAVVSWPDHPRLRLRGRGVVLVVSDSARQLVDSLECRGVSVWLVTMCAYDTLCARRRSPQHPLRRVCRRSMFQKDHRQAFQEWATVACDGRPPVPPEDALSRHDNTIERDEACGTTSFSARS